MKKLILLTSFISAAMFNIFGQGKDNSEKEFNKIKGKIYPIIKVESKETDGKKSIEFTAENQPVFKKIAGDLLCFYGVDKGDNFVLLAKSQIPNNVSLDKIDEIAKANLLANVQKNLKMQSTNFGALGFTCGGDHEAALILLPEIWGVLNEELGDRIVFGVPSKDMCIFVKEDMNEGIRKLQEMIIDIHKDGERLLSKNLFKYSNGQIEVYTE